MQETTQSHTEKSTRLPREKDCRMYSYKIKRNETADSVSSNPLKCSTLKTFIKFFGLALDILISFSSAELHNNQSLAYKDIAMIRGIQYQRNNMIFPYFERIFP